MKQHNTPCVNIACIENYEMNWARGFGVGRTGTDHPVTPATIFEAASTTKLLNTILILRLAEQGMLSLTEDVNSYLSTWKIPENELTRSHPVTLINLLTHTAGLPSTNFRWEEDPSPTLLDVLNG